MIFAPVPQNSLRAAGIAIITDPQWDDPAVGRFARIHDPEGKPSNCGNRPPESKVVLKGIRR
jgi:hypothetical protein